MDKLVNIKLPSGKIIEVEQNTTINEILNLIDEVPKRPVLVAKVDNEIVDLNRKIAVDCTLELLDITSSHGFRAYQNSLAFCFICGAKEVLGKDCKVVIQHSIGKNYYCKIINKSITKDIIDKIENVMRDKVKNEVKIEKKLIPVTTAIELCEETSMDDKVEILKFRRGSNVHMYQLDWFYNYFYGALVMDCSKLEKFKLELHDDNIIIRFPEMDNPDELIEIKKIDQILEVFNESSKWARILGIDTVGNLNRKMIDGKFGEVIRISEALHEKKIANIADMISENHKKLILIAGPSSSGKTTFAQRLSIQLRVNGLKPHIISLDDYYLNRSEIPFGEDGRQNFEVVEALDINMINRDIEKLIAGESVEIPHFNFVTGNKEYKGRFLKLEDDDVIIMEGIHGLNEVLTKNIKKQDKFKIFISALTQLNVDNHNRISTTDTRLVRRLVRDSKFRGFGAKKTIDMWPTVLQGEIENIFPYQNEADAVFNSALVYEMCVLKTYVEPLLFDLQPNVVEYSEAKRLVKFLENFLTINTEEIPKNSLIREFIGGSCF